MVAAIDGGMGGRSYWGGEAMTGQAIQCPSGRDVLQRNSAENRLRVRMVDHPFSSANPP